MFAAIEFYCSIVNGQNFLLLDNIFILKAYNDALENSFIGRVN